MQNNFLEELVAEWLEYTGYIVKRNERIGQFVKGGQGEMDVVAFNPQIPRLIHVEAETSVFVNKPRKNIDSWNASEEKFKKKFETGEKYIRDLFKGLTVPDVIEKVALFAYGAHTIGRTFGGGQVVLAKNYVLTILHKLKKSPSRIVPEKYPILRVLQTVTENWGYFDKGLK